MLHRWEMHLNVVVFDTKTHIEVREKANDPAPTPIVVNHTMSKSEVIQYLLVVDRMRV